ncbi:MAG: hypothetical protein ACRD1Z_21540, partial [Vicinamibacteria bacterium]
LLLAGFVSTTDAKALRPGGDDWTPPSLSDDEKKEWKDGRPPGWSQGQKKGWEGGDLPPGLAKKNPPGWDTWTPTKRRSWESELGRALETLLGDLHKKNLPKPDRDDARFSFENLAREGVPVGNALAIIRDAIAGGVTGRDLGTAGRGVAHGVGKDVDFDELGDFVHDKLEAGLRGNDLAIEIYKEVERRHEERMKAKSTIGKSRGHDEEDEEEKDDDEDTDEEHGEGPGHGHGKAKGRNK